MSLITNLLPINQRCCWIESTKPHLLLVSLISLYWRCVKPIFVFCKIAGSIYAFFVAGQPDKAEKDIMTVVRIDPQWPKVAFCIAIICFCYNLTQQCLMFRPIPYAKVRCESKEIWILYFNVGGFSWSHFTCSIISHVKYEYSKTDTNLIDNWFASTNIGQRP